MEKIRGENWTITLYPQEENGNDKRILDYITNNFYYAYILHNKDIEKETGELKKDHTHIVFTFENARSLETISKELNIEENRIEKVRNLRKMIRYLIHMDNKEKYQYEKAEIQSNIWEKIEKFLDKDNDAESYEIRKIFEFIYSIDRYLYLHEVLDFVLYNNMYGSYRRGANILNKIIEEHNKLFVEKKESEKIKKEMEKKEIWEFEKRATKNNQK